MLKKSIAAALIAAAFSASLSAEEEEKSKVTVDAGVDFVSNYVWRGGDMFTMYAEQKNKSYGNASGAWAMQPSATINMPVEGLYVGFWGSFAMQGRNDVDSDKRFQLAPGGSDLFIDNGYITKDAVDFSNLTSVWNLYAAADSDFFLNDPANMQGKAVLDYLQNYGTPNYHKEANGLKRLDEVDISLGYATSSNFGEFDVGLVSYVAANPVAKNWVSNELYVIYALPFFTDLSFAMYTDIATASQYYQVAYEKAFELSEGMEVFGGIGAGYGVKDQLQGLQDVTGQVGFSAHGFSISYNLAYRPDTRFFDPDDHQTLPLDLYGISSKTDGLVADPRYNTGIANQLFQSGMSAEIQKAIPGYSYTPLQKIPRTLEWVAIGYSTSFE